MTTRQLAGELEVSQRTVLRDIEALSAAGIPVYAVRGCQGGFELLDGFSSDLPSAGFPAGRPLPGGPTQRARVRCLRAADGSPRCSADRPESGSARPRGR
jgi:HTH domain